MPDRSGIFGHRVKRIESSYLSYPDLQLSRQRPVSKNPSEIKGVESKRGAVARIAPFPRPAHRTGRADFPHPALGEEIHASPHFNAQPSALSVRFQITKTPQNKPNPPKTYILRPLYRGRHFFLNVFPNPLLIRMRARCKGWFATLPAGSLPITVEKFVASSSLPTQAG